MANDTKKLNTAKHIILKYISIPYQIGTNSLIAKVILVTTGYFDHFAVFSMPDDFELFGNPLVIADNNETSHCS